MFKRWVNKPQMNQIPPFASSQIQELSGQGLTSHLQLHWQSRTDAEGPKAANAHAHPAKNECHIQNLRLKFHGSSQLPSQTSARSGNGRVRKTLKIRLLYFE